VPPGSTAVLEIPTPDPGSVRHDDAPVTALPFARGATVRLASGRYTFTATSY
jgi:alpha-L-rhamnosidase